jgi:heme-degrading monooxygenase HmoA
MFVHLAVLYPKHGHEGDLVDSMRRFDAALEGHPGLQKAYTLRDRGSGNLVGLAFWDSKEHWQAARRIMLEAIKDDDFHDWEDKPADVYHLEEI